MAERCARCRSEECAVRCSCCSLLLCSGCAWVYTASCPRCLCAWFANAEDILLVNEIVRQYVAHPDLFSLAAAPARAAFAKAKERGVPEPLIRLAGQRARDALRRRSLRQDEIALAKHGDSGEHLIGTGVI